MIAPPDPPGRARLEEIRSRFPGRPEGGGPPALAAYLEKVRSRAHAITDEDVSALRAAGLSEEQIYEATMREALGAALERFDAGLRALRAAKR